MMMVDQKNTFESSAIDKNISCISVRETSTSFRDDVRLFVTGSWGSESNEVCVRSLNLHSHKPSPKSLINTVGSYKHKGDVNSISFADSQTFCTSSSSGALTAYHLSELKFSNQNKNRSRNNINNTSRVRSGFDDVYNSDSPTPIVDIEPLQVWKGVHDGPMTCADIDGSKALTCGEDGFVRLIDFGHGGNSGVTVVDSKGLSLYKVLFSSPTEFLTMGLGGSIRQWDLRENNNFHSSSSSLSSTLKPINTLTDMHSPSLVSVTTHPSRSNVLATGSSTGLIGLWDLRMSTIPTCSLAGHENGSTWDIEFLSSDPSILYSCGQDGSLIRWDFNKNNGLNEVTFSHEQAEHIDSELSLSYTSPINCLALDHQTNTLLCGTDSRSIILGTNL